MDTPRGVRNNNPGNLRKNLSDKWQGLSLTQRDDAFFQFDDAVYGIRAIARTLIAYQDKNNCHTIAEIIGRWAPPSDNNPTDIYCSNVATHVGIARNLLVDMHDYAYLRPTIEAIITQESGGSWQQFYTSAQIDKGMVLAGVEPRRKSLLKNAQIVGSAIAGAATVAQPVVESAQDKLQPLMDYSDSIKHAFIGLALVGVVLTMIAKINERNKGIS